MVPIIERVRDIHLKNVPPKFQEDFKNIFRVIVGTTMVIRTDVRMDGQTQATTPWHAIISMISLYIVNPRGPRCMQSRRRKMFWHYMAWGTSTNCSIFSLVHIGFFSINGTNLWNALFDGMDLVANLLKSIEVPSRVVFYPFLYSMCL